MPHEFGDESQVVGLVPVNAKEAVNRTPVNT